MLMVTRGTLIVHLLALLFLYITNLRVLARHHRTSTLVANLELRAYIIAVTYCTGISIFGCIPYLPTTHEHIRDA